jgi:MYXO-CTERM domain-containing protein
MTCEHITETPVDGAALSAALRAEVVVPREAIAGIFAAPYVTRLRTAISAVEMTEDPIFAFNRDLEDVSNVHVATQHVGCDGESPDYEHAIIELADGRRLGAEALVSQPIARLAGETVRGIDVQAAARVEQYYAAGQPTLVVDYMAEADRASSGQTSDAGCGCRADDRGPTGLWALLALALLGLRRRSRR